MEFEERFTLAARERLKLRRENFVNFDAIYPDLMTPFLKHSQEFNPIPGMLVQPSQEVFRAPTEKEIQDIIASGDASKIRNATKNIAYWLPKKKGPAQLTALGGFGARLSVWLPPCPKTTPPDFRLPPKVLANPVFKPLDIPGEIEMTFALADSFLPRSLQVFAPEIQDNPQYAGMPFAVPLLTSRDIITTRGEVREAWLSLLGAYLAESREDQGILLWGSVDIDPLMLEIVAALHEENIFYPTA
ncbi:MAG: hypothetical protein K2X03_29140 [Bryobacteraceae bacterium]|nr:hypothetical protein [Bryobacteraceae bacterium]